MRITSGDICEIAGVPQNTLNDWVNKGLLSPTNNGQGHGRHREYSVMDAVAVAYANAWREFVPGNYHGPASIIRTIAAMNEEQLQERIDAGQTLLIPIREFWFDPNLLPLNREQRIFVNSMNVETIYGRVKRRIAERSTVESNGKH